MCRKIRRDEMSAIANLKIGTKEYEIKLVDELHSVDRKIYGDLNYYESRIRIVEGSEQHDKNHTLIHEMLHALCLRFSLYALGQDEQTIDLLALGIYEAILDNPHLFLMEDI
jgi:hypothetical protein